METNPNPGPVLELQPALNTAMVIDLMHEGYAIEKNPVPDARIIVSKPSAESVLGEIVLSSGKFAPYAAPEVRAEDGGSTTPGGEEEVVSQALNGNESSHDAVPPPDAVGESEDEETKFKDLLLSARRSKLGKVMAAAALFSTGLLAYNSSPASADPAATENVPTQTQPAGSIGTCIKKGLAMPKIIKAYVVHPGRRPFSGRNSSEAGAMQKTNLSVKYPEIGCDEDVLRMGIAVLQKEVSHDVWRNPYAGNGMIAFGYRSNRAGLAGVGRLENGHDEPDWYFLKPGEHERMILKQIVKNPQTGQVLGTQKETVPVEIRWGS